MAPHDHDHNHTHDHHDHAGHDHHHEHNDHHAHDHGDEHHHSHDEQSYNNGILKWAFSKAGGQTGDWLRRHRQKIILGAGAALAVAEYTVTNNTALSSIPLLFAGAAVAHDASEDVIESAGKLKESQNLSSGVVGTAVGFGHTLSEGIFSFMNTAQGNSDLAVSSVMGSNSSHILLMAGGAAVIGTVGAGQSAMWKLHAAGIGGLTAMFGAQIAQGEFNPAMGAAMAAGGAYYLYKRVQSGETCAIHGDACSGHDHDHEHHHHDHDHDHAPKPLTLRQRMSDPEMLKLGGAVLALMPSAHVLGHQVLTISESAGMSNTAAGASIAALSMAAPEIVLTWKAAHKGDRDMAWGSITGCTVATVGVVGGGLALGGAEMPVNLDLATTEGKVHMTAFAGSAAALIAATHPKINKSGKIPKWLGAAFLTAGVGYYASVTQPNCHWDGPRIHCIDNEAVTDSEGESLYLLPGLDGP